MQIYPDCPAIIKTIEIGGQTKWQLTQNLQAHSISMNALGERLISDDQFTTSKSKYSLTIVELSVRHLGFPNGATIPQLFKQANELGLELCPLEVGPYLRLEYLNQPEGNIGSLQQNQAPSGSITIASKIVTDDDDFPKGFYLRKIDGVLWLRGYLADDLHVWNPDDRFIFSQTTKP